MDVPRVPRGRNVYIVISVNSEDINLQRSGSPRRVNQVFSAYTNFRKMNWKKVQASIPNAKHAQISSEIANMWKKTSNEDKEKCRKVCRSPCKVRELRISKGYVNKNFTLELIVKRSGSPRRARKDKDDKKNDGKRSGSPRKARKISEYNMFVKKYSAFKRAALGITNQREILKALASDWRAGIRSY